MKAPARGKNARPAVLLIEDSEATRAHYARVLGKSYEVREAATGAAAIESARRSQPDLVLVDCVLPDIDGFELTQKLRDLPGGLETPIVGISSYYPVAEGAPIFPVRFDAFLVKPVDPERLVDTVKQFLPALVPQVGGSARKHVLVVDDDRIQLRLAHVHLTNAGFRVTAVLDPDTAVSVAKGDRPDVILSDALMPGTDGFDLCLAIRNDHELRSVPVVLMSPNLHENGDTELAARVGADALVERRAGLQEAIAEVRERVGTKAKGSFTATALSRGDRERKLIHQLERQVTINAALAQRCGMQAMQLSILGGVAETLAKSNEVKNVLRDVLAHCLDTSGLTKGALYRVGPDATLAFDDAVGFAESETPKLATAFGRFDILERVLTDETATVISPRARDGAEAFLASSGATSALVVPLVGAGHRLGALLLISNAADVMRQDLLGFGKALAAYIGQALALALAFNRLSESERKNEHLSVLAHELRGPLAPIVTAAELIKLRLGDVTAVKRARDTIARQALHLTRIVDDLLDASRLAHGKIKLVPESVDLVALVREVVGDKQPMIDKAAVQVTVSVPAAPIKVMADRTRLVQAIDNVLANAIKFSVQGGRISVSAATVDGSAVVAVQDNGAGIPLQILPRIFDPFTQADHSLARTSGGLGLGLSVAKGLIELHGGIISATSEGLGKGSVFTIILPLESGATPENGRVKAVAPPVPAPGRRILLIEDNEDAAAMLCELLQLTGHTVEVAHTGRTGIEAANRFKPQVVLCDIGLPDMDGYAVGAKLRAEGDTRHLVAITGYGQDEDVKRALAAGFDQHLTKPVGPDELLKLIDGIKQ